MKNILIGVTGGIAAYKLPECIRQLREKGYNVRVVMTRAAEEFVTETTLEAVSGSPVYKSLWDEQSMLHIELARWADLILIAPATANCIAKLAYGLADDLLSTICTASTASVIVAPAMNREMWANQANQSNIQTLHLHGISVVGPAEGEQACGEVGMGRMVEPAEIVSFVSLKMNISNQALVGRNILITAGPTREAIDSIRYLSNRSSGKMGYALAQIAHDMGANVTLVSGPTELVPPNVTTVLVQSAEEMYNVAINAAPMHDIFISAAAVADYTPNEVSQHKIKKTDHEFVIHCKRTKDILKCVAALEEPPYCVGFAAEDVDLIESAKQKLISKNIDMIVANHIDESFGHDHSEVVVLVRNGDTVKLERQSKLSVAHHILNILSEKYKVSLSELV
jgi:phosphopantothenoylcysteine decarboxylase/phosphopantothenate--cysteine ligase